MKFYVMPILELSKIQLVSPTTVVPGGQRSMWWKVQWLVHFTQYFEIKILPLNPWILPRKTPIPQSQSTQFAPRSFRSMVHEY